MSQQHTGMLMVLASAAGFATLAIFIKLAFAAGANTITILAIRFILASLILWLVLKLNGISPVINQKTIIQLCLMGALGYGTMSALFALTVESLPASLAAMLLYTYPAIVSILSFVIGDEQITWQKCLALAICFSGLVLILGVSFAGINPLGIMFGLGASLVYSCYILIGNRVLKNVNSLLATTYVCTAAGVAFTAFGMTSGQLILNLPLAGWLASGGITLLATIVAILAFFGGLARIGAANTSIISTMEPLITVALSILLFDEKVTLLQAGGGLLIITGVVVLQVWGHSSSTDTIRETLTKKEEITL